MNKYTLSKDKAKELVTNYYKQQNDRIRYESKKSKRENKGRD